MVVKPNIGWDRTPEQAANTHPDVVKAIVQQCLDAGAKQVLVFDRTCNDARRCYANSGIQAAVESIGDQPRPVRLSWTRRSSSRSRSRRPSRSTSSRSTRTRLEPDCDCYINVPIAKHHMLAKLTLGLKNVMGVIGGNRGEIHKVIHQRIADLNLVVRPQADDHRRHPHPAAQRPDGRKPRRT